VANPWTNANLNILSRLILYKRFLLFIKIAENWLQIDKALLIYVLHYTMNKLLTLCFTVSFILSPALLTTPDKKDPNDFAPAVILLVTVRTLIIAKLFYGSK
jgi:hypothetical protein